MKSLNNFVSLNIKTLIIFLAFSSSYFTFCFNTLENSFVDNHINKEEASGIHNSCYNNKTDLFNLTELKLIETNTNKENFDLIFKKLFKNTNSKILFESLTHSQSLQTKIDKLNKQQGFLANDLNKANKIDNNIQIESSAIDYRDWEFNVLQDKFILPNTSNLTLNIYITI